MRKRKEYTLSLFNTCDILLIREILIIALKAVELPTYQISGSGRIQEWFYDFAEPDVSHRHTSHLLGFILSARSRQIRCRNLPLPRKNPFRCAMPTMK